MGEVLTSVYTVTGALMNIERRSDLHKWAWGGYISGISGALKKNRSEGRGLAKQRGGVLGDEATSKTPRSDQ